jgi:sugar phosphate isomerase/epimerase
MRINKKNFLIQVKYSDIFKGSGNIKEYFLGFGGELYLSAEEVAGYDPRIIESINSFVKNNRLSLRLHSPIAEIDYSKTSSFLPLYRKTIRFCKDLNINHVVTHADFRYHTDFPVDKQFEKGAYFWRALSDEFRKNNIYMNIENHYEIEPRYLIMLMEKINSPYLGMCIDIGHANAFSDIGIEEWLKRYPAGSIKEVHLADNKGDGDTHLPLGEGNIDFMRFFKIFLERREPCVFVLEPRDVKEAEKSLSYLRKAGVIA